MPTHPNYDRFPKTRITGFDDAAVAGYEAIVARLIARAAVFGQPKVIIAIECYPGVLETEVLPALQSGLKPVLTVLADDALWPHEHIKAMLARDLTEDRVRGFMNNWRMEEFFDAGKLAELQQRIATVTEGVVLVYGTGATLVAPGDVLVYADLARWEIQLRYRRGDITNWGADNRHEDFLRMYKRGYFVDWRVADRRKQTLLGRIDFLVDTNTVGSPKMITGEAFRAALHQTARRPFRVVPYFDAGPWGGQWMKRVCQLDPAAPNYAWCFDGVPEENSLLLDFGGPVVEVPALDLVLDQPGALLGDLVHARFGAEFPIRFDFLDTMGGGNLSLQVHPTTEYMREHFGLPYTQDESYYLLDAEPGAVVYLGVKTGVDPKALIADLERAQAGEIDFDAEKYVNVLPARKHDHFLIPAGTIHCSGANSMVLEISATPYIFTFKLWDWGRLGLDGKPRPIHIEHGQRVLNYTYDTEAIHRDHVNCIEPVAQGDGWREERTGLHRREFIETRRHWFTGTVPHDTQGNVNMLNLVQGAEAIIESPTNAFPPLVVHYAETFIIPASVGPYTIRPHGPGADTECATMKAFVRG